jgi:hypothetical protein
MQINWFGESICGLVNCWNVTFESKQGKKKKKKIWVIVHEKGYRFL